MSKMPQLGVYILLGEAKQTRKRISKHERETRKGRGKIEILFSLYTFQIDMHYTEKFLENVLLFYIFKGKIT